MLSPTLYLRVYRDKDWSDAEFRGVRFVDTLQQLWVDVDAHGNYTETEWRDVPIVEKP